MAIPKEPLHDLLPGTSWRQTFRRRLRSWYRRHARDLPWRRTRDPYAIWVSEIMLQQTQVATVIPYYERFLSTLPTIADLAAAKEERVLRLWEGLGYYRRARQLHQAARRIVAEHGGEFPRDVADVEQLPGVGRYTRGAVLSLAFDARLPILEANTLRLYCRLLAFDGDPRGAEGQALLWKFAATILPRQEVGEFNQALMELGATICSPREPRCLICPAAALCPTRREGRQNEIPRRAPKIRYEDVEEVAVVVEREGAVLLRRRQEGERWAGLWDFPRFAAPPLNGSCDRRAAREVKRLTGVQVELDGELATIKHGVTRFRITLHCRRARYVSGALKHKTECNWVSAAELDDFPLSVTGRRIAQLWKAAR